MECYEAEVRALERLRAADPRPCGDVVFYGSSSIRMWSTLAEDFPGVPVRNLGFGGSTLSACSWFFERLVVPHRPRALLVYAGDNDLGDGQSPEAVLQSYRYLMEQVDRRLGAIPFAFLAIKPSLARWGIIDRIRRTNDLIRVGVEQRPNSVWVDLYTPMLTPAGTPRPELFAEDGLHLSADGYHLWTEVVHREAEALLLTPEQELRT